MVKYFVYDYGRSLMNNSAAAFLEKHNFPLNFDMNPIVDSLLYDMHEGLSGRKAGQDMIRTFCVPPEKKLAGESVIPEIDWKQSFRANRLQHVFHRCHPRALLSVRPHGDVLR